jgi:hypothetical protein
MPSPSPFVDDPLDDAAVLAGHVVDRLRALTEDLDTDRGSCQCCWGMAVELEALRVIAACLATKLDEGNADTRSRRARRVVDTPPPARRRITAGT